MLQNVNRFSSGNVPRTLVATILASFLGLSVGCGEPTASFTPNVLFATAQQEQSGINEPQELAAFVNEQEKSVVDAVAALFGVPDEPFMLAVDGADEVLQLRRLKLAAGPVRSDEQGKASGLYRQHCVHCHGITGNGRGPTAAFLNPYPRDFTMGKFKFTSTPVGVKPTTEDLRRILENGIPGTAMPSFGLLSEGDLDALVDYVKFLSIRGEVERRLISEYADFFDPEDEAANVELKSEFFGPGYLVEEVLSSVVSSWQSAESMATPVPQRPAVYDRWSDEFDDAQLQASIDRGRELYYSNEAQCTKCHGPAQLGDGQTNDYDDWSKDFWDWQKDNPDKMAQYLRLGGLKPRNVIPRNLRDGVFRGGRRPVDVFWRIHNGIEGSGMPESNKAALSNEDLWDIVNFVMELAYEPASLPGVELRTNTKEVR